MIMTDTTEDNEEEEESLGTLDGEEDFVTLGDDDDDDDDDENNNEEDNDDNDNNEDSTQQHRRRDLLPPWMSQDVVHRGPQGTNHLVALHNEIVGFCTLMEPRPDEMKQREELVVRFTKLATKIFVDCEVQVFGSQATGLCLPTSDIDIDTS